MDRKEFIEKMQTLERAMADLREEYKASMPVKPKQWVVIDGKEYWLERYTIVGYSIRPTLYDKIDGKIGRLYGVVHLNNWRKMKPKYE